MVMMLSPHSNVAHNGYSKFYEEDEPKREKHNSPPLPFLYIDTPRKLNAVCQQMLKLDAGVLALDTETTGLNPATDRLVTIQLFCEGLAAPLVIDCRKIPLETIRNNLWPFLTGPDWLKVAHNMKFDYSFILHELGISMERIYCSQLAEKILTAGLNAKTDLATVAERHTGEVLDKSVRLDFTTIGDGELSNVLMAYAATDVALLIQIMYSQYQEMERRGLLPTYRLELKVLPALAEASMYGVLLDKDKWRAHIHKLELRRDEIGAELTAELQEHYEGYADNVNAIKQQAYLEAISEYTDQKSEQEAMAQIEYERALANGDNKRGARQVFNEYKRNNPISVHRPTKPVLEIGNINLGSYDQLQGALSHMGVRLPIKRATGKLETDRANLNMVADKYPIVSKLLKFREYQKLITAFGENILERLGEDGRLHPDFNQCVSTGRMSCRNPNVQQIPSNELGQDFRSCFVAPPGRSLVSIDYSQIELRILMELSGEEDAIEAINNGLDLHSQTTARMFGVPYEEVQAEKDGKYKHIRKVAKTINFGVAYGLSPMGLSRNINIPIKDAKEYINAYFSANKKVSQWLEKTAARGLSRSYAETLLGRKRFFANIGPKPYDAGMGEWEKQRRTQERMMCNHAIQGTSADITKLAIARIRAARLDEEYDAHMVMFIHDEIVLDVPQEYAEEAAETVSEIMRKAARRFLKRVEVEVSYQIGDCWTH